MYSESLVSHNPSTVSHSLMQTCCSFWCLLQWSQRFSRGRYTSVKSTAFIGWRM